MFTVMGAGNSAAQPRTRIEMRSAFSSSPNFKPDAATFTETGAVADHQDEPVVAARDGMGPIFQVAE